ncbi:MAG: aminotransferase class III-fold pyridoxal phosphate-dependent enzyme [Firmicutes bacterium]|nr:aminotransferase class III-fold pyridoxal phosphate-dependent enzyme [Bacillota bacterium]
MHPYPAYVNPHLGELLETVQLDKRFVRGRGPWLWDSDGNRYLDFIAAYGALPFGYNPPEIWAALEAVRDAEEPSFVQPSYLDAAGELARRLVELAPAGLTRVTFTNSGAEAVEAAIKLARAATGRLRILAAHNSFHGKTLGALSATGRRAYQDAFGAPVAGFDFVPYGDANAVADALAGRPGEYAAVILEPIQGEGGIVVPPSGYLAEVARLCREHGALFILDEIQSGLGRTGTLFRCEAEGVAPDVMTLAKALSGGLVPIGAVLCTEEAYSEEFALKHSSTFAGNTLACRAGLAALDMLTGDGGRLLENVRRLGRKLRSGLDELKRRYPGVIREVRGEGFMLGIDFGIDRDTFGSDAGSLLGVLADQEMLTPAVASYLLNRARLRVAPTLNGSSVIRIEPPLVVDDEQCDMALSALERVCAILAKGNTGELLAHLVGRVTPVPVPATGPEPAHSGRSAPRPEAADGRFAFLVHPLDLTNYTEFDRSLEAYSSAELKTLSERFNSLVEPFVIGRARIVSPTGQAAYGEFVVVPRTTRQLLEGSRRENLDIVAAAVKLARDRGAGIVGLGAYTAIVSRGGRALTNLGVALTTGNSYTVAAAIEALVEGASRLGEDLTQTTAAVVGATGSIGRGTALLLAPDVRRLVLVGNPRSGAKALARLSAVAGEIARWAAAESRKGRRFSPDSVAGWLLGEANLPDPEADPAEWEEAMERLLSRSECPIGLTTDIQAGLAEAQMVVIATSTAEEFVTPAMLRPGAVVCDMSRPPNVSREVEAARPDVLVLDGGVIEVPGRPWFGWNFGYEPGLAYACMSETMMLALEKDYRHTSLGSDLSPDSILRMSDLAARHGFRLAGLRSFDRPMTARRWQQLLAARRQVLSPAAP